jgi:hypothetical protein
VSLAQYSTPQAARQAFTDLPDPDVPGEDDAAITPAGPLGSQPQLGQDRRTSRPGPWDTDTGPVRSEGRGSTVGDRRSHLDSSPHPLAATIGASGIPHYRCSTEQPANLPHVDPIIYT